MDRPVSAQSQATGRMLRAVRTGLGFTLEEFATRIGTSPSTLSRFETGQRHVSAAKLDAAAEIVGEVLAERTHEGVA